MLSNNVILMYDLALNIIYIKYVLNEEDATE